MTVDESGPVCRCGNRGCLETFAGAEAVARAAAPRHGDDLTLREAIALAAAGDHGCQRVIADAGPSARAWRSRASATCSRPSA